MIQYHSYSRGDIMSKVLQKSFSKKIVQSQKKDAVKKWTAAMVSKYPPKSAKPIKTK